MLFLRSFCFLCITRWSLTSCLVCQLLDQLNVTEVVLSGYWDEVLRSCTTFNFPEYSFLGSIIQSQATMLGKLTIRENTWGFFIQHPIWASSVQPASMSGMLSDPFWHASRSPSNNLVIIYKTHIPGHSTIRNFFTLKLFVGKLFATQ